MKKWNVTVQIQVSAESYGEAIDEADSILHHALGFLDDVEDIPYEVVTADEIKEEEKEDGQ